MHLSLVRIVTCSRCYRAETADIAKERGIYRVHQFTKVCRPCLHCFVYMARLNYTHSVVSISSVCVCCTQLIVSCGCFVA